MPSKDDVISNIQTITKQINEILLIIKENKRKGINEGNNVNLLALKEIQSNLNKLKIVNSKSFAMLSEIKKKPAKIFSRLF